MPITVGTTLDELVTKEEREHAALPAEKQGASGHGHYIRDLLDGLSETQQAAELSKEQYRELRGIIIAYKNSKSLAETPERPLEYKNECVAIAKKSYDQFMAFISALNLESTKHPSHSASPQSEEVMPPAAQSQPQPPQPLNQSSMFAQQQQRPQLSDTQQAALLALLASLTELMRKVAAYKTKKEKNERDPKYTGARVLLSLLTSYVTSTVSNGFLITEPYPKALKLQETTRTNLSVFLDQTFLRNDKNKYFAVSFGKSELKTYFEQAKTLMDQLTPNPPAPSPDGLQHK